jgi:hypothetical protein
MPGDSERSVFLFGGLLRLAGGLGGIDVGLNLDRLGTAVAVVDMSLYWRSLLVR